MKVKGTGAKIALVAKAAIGGFPLRLFIPIALGIGIGLLPLLLGGGAWGILSLIGWTVIGLLVGIGLVAMGAVKG